MQRDVVTEWVDRIDAACVAALDKSVVASGAVVPPTVHLLVGGLDPPYLGSLTCRPFYRGEDAKRATAGMGLLGSMLGAVRLVVSFENADLVSALKLPDADLAPTALAVVDADLNGGHTVRWHPLLMLAGTTQTDGSSSVTTSWEPVSVYPGLPLPVPVQELLELWRAPRVWSDVDVLRVYAAMEAGGYIVRWARRPDGESGQPSWMRLLAPVR